LKRASEEELENLEASGIWSLPLSEGEVGGGGILNSLPLSEGEVGGGGIYNL